MDKPPTVAQWFQQKYLDWQREQGQLASMKAFAAALEISYPTLHKYLTGHSVPATRALPYLADQLGYELYALMGLIPDDRTVQLLDLLSQLDDHHTALLLEYAAQLLTQSTE